MRRLLGRSGVLVEGRSAPQHVLFAATLVTVLLCCVALSGYRIGEPAWEAGYHGFVLSEYPHNAYNYLRFGYLETGFGPVMNNGAKIPPAGFVYRVSHGNVTALLISLSYRAFGVSEWSARLVPVALAVSIPVVIYALALRLTARRWWALLAFTLCALSPMLTFYARLPGPHNLAVAFSLMAFLTYWIWLEVGRGRWLAATFALLVVGVWTDWIAYFTFPALLFHYLLWGGARRRLAVAVALALSPFLLFGTYVLWVWWLSPGSSIAELQKKILIRTGTESLGAEPFTNLELARIFLERSVYWLTLPVLVLTLIWLVILVRALLRRNISPAWGLVVALLLFGLLHNVVFRNRIYVHDFIGLYQLVPALAIAATLGLKELTQLAGRRTAPIAAAAIVVVVSAFVVQSIQGYVKAHENNGARYRAAYYAGTYLREIVPETGRYINTLEGSWPIVDSLVDRDYYNIRYDPSQTADGLVESQSFEGAIFKNTDKARLDVAEALIARYPRWEVAGYSIFQLRGQSPGASAVYADGRAPQFPTSIRFGEGIEFLGYDLERVVYRRDSQIGVLDRYLVGSPELLPRYRTTFRVATYWRRLTEQATDYSLVTSFLDETEQYTLERGHAGLTDLYPTSRWPTMQVIRDEFEIEVPSGYPEREYAMLIAVQEGGESLPPATSELPVDESSRVRIGSIELRSSPPAESDGMTAEHTVGVAR